MMNDSKYIANLKTSRRSYNLWKELMDNIHDGRYERLSSKDSFKIGIPVVLIITKGKGNREVIQDIQYLYGDTGNIGKCMGEIYIYDKEKRVAYPRRFNRLKDRILKDLLRKD